MRSPEYPDSAIIVTTYLELATYCHGFLAGKIPALLIIGAPGLGKSRFFSDYADPRLARIFKGHVTPMKFYCHTFHNLNKLLILDDAERLWGDKTGRRLIRSLCELSREKWMEWGTIHKHLERECVPQRFETRSRLAIICNRFVGGRSDETEAILDRCLTICFKPTVNEVYRWIGTWFWDQEIYNYVYELLPSISKLSGRMVTKAYSLKRLSDAEDSLEINWRTELAKLKCDGDEQCVREVESNHDNVEERIHQFESTTGRSRATYYRIRSRLEREDRLSVDRPEWIRLSNSSPDEADLLADVREGAESISEYYGRSH